MRNSHDIELEINVTTDHIHQASRTHGRWTPVDLAILRDTIYLPVGMLDQSLQLMDSGGVEYSCPLPPAMRDFLQRFEQGLPVGPARFELTCSQN